MRRFLLGILVFLGFSLSLNGETYVVCVGISGYAHPKVKDLRLPEKDAKDVAAFYKLATDKVITVTGKYATKAQILKCLNSQFSRAGEKDRIIFYFSGHGYPGGFCPYDMTRLDEGLSYQEVISIMNQSNAKAKLIFADACNSGAIRHSERQAARPQTGNVLLFLSSRGNELSIESRLDDNGFFTKYLLRGLKGGADTDRNLSITAKVLFLFVSEGVKIRSKDKQHPVMWGNFDDNLSIVEYKKR